MTARKRACIATILLCLILAQASTGQTQAQVDVPSNRTFRLELLLPISTATNKKGDKFICRVLAPKEFRDATIVGIIARIKSRGSANNSSEIAVAFESITLIDGRTARFDGQMTDVYDLISTNKETPDEERQIKGETIQKRTVTISTRVSSGLGGLLGGLKGAAVGAAAGSALAVLNVLSEKAPELEFHQGTQFAFRTIGARTGDQVESQPSAATVGTSAGKHDRARTGDQVESQPSAATVGTSAGKHDRASTANAANTPPNAKKIVKGRFAAKPGGTQLASTSIHRHPTMECPNEIAVGQQFALQISLTKNLITPQVGVASGKTTEDEQLSLDLPGKSDQITWKIDIVLSASDFLFSKGTNTATILLDKDTDSSPAVFYLEAKSIQDPRLSKVYATFWHEGVFLARVFRDIAILAPPSGHESTKTKAAGELASRSNAAALSSLTLATPRGSQLARASEVQVPQIEMNFGLEKADLTVFIFNNEIIIDSPYLQPASYPYYQAEDLSRWLDLQYTKFAGLAARGLLVHKDNLSTTMPIREQASLAMRGFGRQLYQEFAPSAFKEAFWQLFDKLGSRFKYIQVFSDNPLLPWELMRPIRKDGTGELEFLGIEFTIGRWHLSKKISQLDRPPQVMPVEKFIVVAPEYERDRNLPGQKTEITSLESIDGFTRLPGRLNSMRTLFENFPQAIIHFAGHGGIESSNQDINEYAIQLEDGILNLTTWKGMINSQNKNHPFFFLNACDVGQAQRIANFVNGWAPAALEAGASGYIGTLWPIGDKGAAEFAAQFYKALYAGLRKGDTSVASVLTETRRSFLQNSDPTFLAYIYYGDPHLKLATHDANNTSEAAQISLGQTIQQVEAALGKPKQIVNLGSKKLYIYAAMKISFVNGKVTDVQ